MPARGDVAPADASIRPVGGVSVHCAQMPRLPSRTVAGLRAQARGLRLTLSQGGAFARAMGGELLRRPAPPQIDGALRAPGLRARVEIIRDASAVPHIYAQCEADALFGLGFVHAQDRYWQMEFYRRAAQGRMAEVAGPVALPSDRLMRSVGLQRAADAAWEALPAASQERVAPYVRGVNAAMERGPRPLEARILNYHPEPWQARDSALWAKLLAFMLSPAWEVQIQRARLIEQAGVEALIALDPGYPVGGPAMIPPGVPFGHLSRELGDAYAALAGATGLGATGAGSNAWAVSAGATAAGTTLFACDPHLTAVNPPYGHFAHIECPEYSLAGATAPGFPGVIWGCNRRIAWGATAGLVSTQDVVVEEFDDAGRYRTPDGWERAGEIEERIAVRGHPDEVLRIRTTRNGPIVSPQIPGVRHALALRSAVLDAPTSVQALLDLPRAGDIDEFRAAVTSFQEFNLVVGYADVEGHIGVQMTGAVPERPPGSAWLPACGWDPAAEPGRLVPAEELPQLFDPPGDRVWAANHAPLPLDALRFDGEFLDAYRAARIGEVLTGSDLHTPETMRRLQVDRHSIAFRTVARHLAALDVASDAAGERERLLLQRVRDWDGEAGVESVPAAIVGVTYSRLLDAVVRAKLGDHASLFFGDVHAVPNLNILLARGASLVVGLLDDAPADWFGAAPPAGGEAAPSGRDVWSAVLLRSFRDAVALLEERLGPDPDRWAWGRVRRVTLKHGLGDVPILAKLFNLGPCDVGSDAQAPLQAGPLGPDPFAPVTGIPALRLIVEMRDPPVARFTLAGGQVGRRGDPHHDDLLEDWSAGRLRPLHTQREDVEADAAHRLRLQPPG